MYNLITILMKKRDILLETMDPFLHKKRAEQQTTGERERERVRVCVCVCVKFLTQYGNFSICCTYQIMIYMNIMLLRTENLNSICYMAHSQLLQNVSSLSLTYITFYMEFLCMIFYTSLQA